jgi:hypothetical protein
MRNAYKIFIGKPEPETSIAISSRKWGGNIKRILDKRV